MEPLIHKAKSSYFLQIKGYISIQQMKDYISFLFDYLYFTQAPKKKKELVGVFCKCEKVIGNHIDQYSQKYFLSKSTVYLRICKVNNSQQFLFPELTFILSQLWHSFIFKWWHCDSSCNNCTAMTDAHIGLFFKWLM